MEFLRFLENILIKNTRLIFKKKTPQFLEDIFSIERPKLTLKRLPIHNILWLIINFYQGFYNLPKRKICIYTLPKSSQKAFWVFVKKNVLSGNILVLPKILPESFQKISWIIQNIPRRFQKGFFLSSFFKNFFSLMKTARIFEPEYQKSQKKNFLQISEGHL